MGLELSAHFQRTKFPTRAVESLLVLLPIFNKHTVRPCSWKHVDSWFGQAWRAYYRAIYEQKKHTLSHRTWTNYSFKRTKTPGSRAAFSVSRLFAEIYRAFRMRERFRQSQLIDRHIELPFLPLSLYSTPPERHSDSENPPVNLFNCSVFFPSPQNRSLWKTTNCFFWEYITCLDHTNVLSMRFYKTKTNSGVKIQLRLYNCFSSYAVFSSSSRK